MDINKIFQYCVDLLNVWADFLGITYEAINIYIFVIGYPLFMLILLGIIVYQRKVIRRLRNKIE